MNNLLRKPFFWVMMLLMSVNTYALPFNIVPKAGTTLPTSVVSGQTATAYYTVLNNTLTAANDFVEYLPPNVTQVTSGGTYLDTCGASFFLAGKNSPNSSCTLQLSITGTVNASDSDPKHHLFVCFPDHKTCAGTNYPLNVTTASITGPQYGYVSDVITGLVSVCSVNTNGSFSNCAATISSIASPYGIATNPAGNSNPAGKFLYVGSSTTNDISVCLINSNGNVASCSIAASGFPAGVVFVAINPTNTIAYLNVSGANLIDYCPINVDGTFGTCLSAGGTYSSPTAIALNPAGTFAYITNYTSNDVTYCAINSTNGSFTSCSSTAAGLAGPAGITINSAGTLAYITNSSTGEVVSCPINGNGSLGVCSTVLSGLSTPVAILLNNINTFVYIANAANSSVTSCVVNSNGTFGACNNTTGFTFPVGVALK